MGDAGAVATTVRKTLSVLNAPTSTPAAIKEASETLGKVKEALQPPAAIQVAQLLLSSVLSAVSQQTPLRAEDVHQVHFGFHLLEDIILRADVPWASFPDVVRAGVKQIAVALFQRVSEADANGTRLYRFPGLVIEKTVSLLSGVAIREWPQRWPDFVDDLMREPQRADLVCRVLRVMSEDIHDYPYLIEDTRRQELIRAMALCLPKTLGFVKGAAEAFHLQKNLDGLTCALETLSAFLSWASLRCVFSAGVPSACFALLRDHQMRGEALSVLSALANRHFTDAQSSLETQEGDDSKEQEVDVTAEFRDIIFSGVLQFVASSSLSSVGAFSLLPLSSAALAPVGQAYAAGQIPAEFDADEHAFCVSFFRMLTDLGCTNFFSTYIHSKRSGTRKLESEAQACALAYVDLMLCAAASSSFSMRHAVLPFFTSSLASIQKHSPTDALFGGNLSRFLTTGYLNASCLALIRFSREYDAVAHQFEAIESDEDDEDELGVRTGSREKFSARTMGCIAVASKLCPEFACIHALERLTSLLSPQGTSNGNYSLPPGAFATPRRLGLIVADGQQHNWKFGTFRVEQKHAWISCLRAAGMSSDAMIASAGHSNKLQDPEKIYEWMSHAFRLTMNISDPALFQMKANLLRIYGPLYSRDPSLMQQCFSTLITQGTDTAGTHQSRFKACFALSVLCKRLGGAGLEALSNYRGPMCDGTAGIIQSPDYDRLNKELLLEAAISTILVGNDLPVQTEFTEKLFNPILESLSGSKVQDALKSPKRLYDFVNSGVTADTRGVCEMFELLEFGTHTIVRPIAKSAKVMDMNTVISKSIAAKAVEVAVGLVRSLHGLYNSLAFPLDGPDGSVRQSVLHPTAKEIVHLLNLGAGTGRYMRDHVDDLRKPGVDEQLGSAERRSSEILDKLGIARPDSKHSRQREALKGLRRSGYEIIRSAILSGVTAPSGRNHLVASLEAIASDFAAIEPIHLVMITDKVLNPLFSFQVWSTGAQYLEDVAKSLVVRLLGVIREHLEHAKLGEIVDSGAPLLDVARDSGRKKLARSVAAMISGIYPKVQRKTEGDPNEKPTFVPAIFAASPLGDEVMLLWKTICSPGRSFLDNGAARVGFAVIVTALDFAPASSFMFFGPLLEASFLTGVQNSGLSTDSPLEATIGAMAAIFRKWPSESEQTVHALLQVEAGRANMAGQEVEWKGWISQCIQQIAGADQPVVKSKKHRSLIKEVVKKVAERTGLASPQRAKVKALPEKLMARNPARARQRKRKDDEEVMLTDTALESLFGDGDPM